MAFISHHSQPGPTELPASEPFQFSEYFLVCEDPRLEQHIQLGTDYGFISFFFKRCSSLVPSSSFSNERVVCIICNVVYVGSPGKVTGNVHAEVFCTGYYLKSLSLHGIMYNLLGWGFLIWLFVIPDTCLD